VSAQFSAQANLTKGAALNYPLFKTYKNMPGSTPQLGARTVRTFFSEAFSLNRVKRDFYPNEITEQLLPVLSSAFLNPSRLLANSSTNFAPIIPLMRTAHTIFTLPNPNPVISTNPYLDIRDYDKLSNSSTPVIRLFHGREDMISENVSDIYKTVWASTDS